MKLTLRGMIDQAWPSSSFRSSYGLMCCLDVTVDLHRGCMYGSEVRSGSKYLRSTFAIPNHELGLSSLVARSDSLDSPRVGQE
jgi:hypothetical protein